MVIVKNKNRIVKTVVHSIGAWILMAATVLSATRIDRQPRIVMNNVVPVYAQVSPINDLARKDSETETVHMPSKFDIGVRLNAISGKK